MQDTFGLPRDLGDGLLLRWATPEDADELGQFNVKIHSDNPEEPEESLAYWTKDLMNGEHPTTKAEDFTVVIDTHNGGKIVSSLNLISQRWMYEGIEFGVGRPELVGTLPEYRRRGLVRAQMEAVHAKSAARGELVQAITGIPWYYRMFGYEMAVNLGGGREFFWNRAGNDKKVDEEIYRWRKATVEDLPQLMALYQAYGRFSLLQRVRDEEIWRYELTKPHKESPYARDFHLIETADGTVVAGVEFRLWGRKFYVRELYVQPGHSWRAVGLFLTRALKKKADELNKEQEAPIQQIVFHMGAGHPVFRALGRQLERQRNPYAWYMRVPDLSRFLQHIAPALDKRLAESVLAGHTGKLKLNLYRQQLLLGWENGRFQPITPYEPKHVEDGDAHFPNLTFLQLLFGYRSMDEVDMAFADCYANEEARILLDILFPKRPSLVIGLG